MSLIKNTRSMYFVIIMLISIEDKSIKSLLSDLQSIKELTITTKYTESNNIINGEHCLIELNGADNEDRLGPTRAAQSGLLTITQVRIGAFLSFFLASGTCER